LQVTVSLNWLRKFYKYTYSCGKQSNTACFQFIHLRLFIYMTAKNLTTGELTIESEFYKFGERYNFTKREVEMFCLMTDGIINTKLISETLKISAHTVSNHFKNMIAKVNVSNKSEILGVFIKRLVEMERNCKGLREVPRVLIVDDEPGICELVLEDLVNRGLEVETVSNPLLVMERLAEYNAHVIILDIQMPKLSGLELLKTIRRKYNYYPAALVITGFPFSKREILNLGGVELFQKPVDHERLFTSVMAHFLDDIGERQRLLRVAIDIDLFLGKSLKLTASNIGFGGLFIEIDQALLSSNETKFSVKGKVSFSFTLGDKKQALEAIGEIIWIREKSRESLPSGIGIKFIQLSNSDAGILKEYVRVHRILSFIPIGAYR